LVSCGVEDVPAEGIEPVLLLEGNPGSVDLLERLLGVEVACSSE
jgi:hypothetical protein